MMPSEESYQELPTGAPDLTQYWALYAHTVDWQVLLHRMVSVVDPDKGLKPLDPKIGMIGFRTADPTTPIWYLSREFFPVEKIAAFVGKKPEDLDGVESLHLREFKDADGKPATKEWQTPSVDYWGQA